MGCSKRIPLPDQLTGAATPGESLEFELLMHSEWQSEWQTRAEARRAIVRYIEFWYNRGRRHSTLGYLSPAAYEAQLQQAA